MAITPNLVEMRKSDGQMEHEMEGGMSMSSPEMYPYGLCIHLEKDQLAALNLPELPEVGETFKMLAMGTVTQSAMEAGGRNPRVSIQITALQLVPEEEESGEQEESEEMGKGGGKGKGPRTVLGSMYSSYG